MRADPNRFFKWLFGGFLVNSNKIDEEYEAWLRSKDDIFNPDHKKKLEESNDQED